MLIRGGRRTVPSRRTRVSARTSSPRKRMCWRGRTGAETRTDPSRSSASSNGTTASHPPGMGEPVMIRTAAPFGTADAPEPPAVWYPAIGSAASPRQSSERTA